MSLKRVSTAVLSLGSNLGDRLAYLRLAVSGFQDAADTELIAASPVYETAAWGGVEQDDFLNAVVLVRAIDLDHWGWLRRCQEFEQQAGRIRTIRWGPRTLDVDVVMVYRADGTPVFSDDPDLVLPHPGTHERNTVLRPWLDLRPEAVLPGYGPVTELLDRLGEVGVRRRDDLVLVGPR